MASPKTLTKLLSSAKFPASKTEWRAFCTELINTAAGQIIEALKTKPLYLNLVPGADGDAASTPVTFKRQNIQAYLDWLFSEKAYPALNAAILAASGYSSKQAAIVSFLVTAFPEAADTECPAEVDDLNTRWNLGLDQLAAKVQKQVGKLNASRYIKDTNPISANPGSYTLSDLKSFGFTPKMIEALPDPRLVDNPMYKSAAPMKLWWRDDIDKIMNTDEFQAQLVKHKMRSEAAKKVAEKKRQETLAEIDEKIGKIKIPQMPLVQLYEESLESKKNFEEYKAAERGWDYDEDGLDNANIATRKRWAVNYIRHELTDYEELLEEIRGKVGTGEAYEKYHDAIQEKIYEAYPELREEKGDNTSYFL